MSSFLLISPDQHFSEVLKEAYVERRLKTDPHVDVYLIQLLKHYLNSKNLFKPFQEDSAERPPQTLAEMYLIGMNAPAPKNKEFMKVLADRALYMSGFFGDSLQKKLIDVDYYMEMGSAAYTNLSRWTKDDQVASTYRIFSENFSEFVHVLNYVSEKSAIKGDQDILRLYERYVRTGSEIARERLNELGVVTLPADVTKISKTSS